MILIIERFRTFSYSDQIKEAHDEKNSLPVACVVFIYVFHMFF